MDQHPNTPPAQTRPNAPTAQTRPNAPPAQTRPGTPPAQTRPLGLSGLAITPMGFGAWAIGGGEWRFGWGAQDERAAIDAIHRGIERGMNWIDTAAVYGLGRSEEIVGRALATLPAARRPLVFTKCSLVWNAARDIGHSLEPASIRRECEASLARLNVEAIDLYQIHWPSSGGSSDAGIEDAVAELDRLRTAGKIRAIGVSNFGVAQLRRALTVAPLASLQPPYSMVKRDIEAEILPFCREHGIGVIVYSPMQSGLLTGAMTRERIAAMPDDDWRRNSADFQPPRVDRILSLTEMLRTIGERHGVSAGAVAVAWTLCEPAVTGAIVGARSAAQVDGTIAGMTLKLNGAELAEIAAALP